MSTDSKIALVILAAGASTRLGEPKQLKVYEGKCLLQKIIDTLNIYDNYIKVLVLGANIELIRDNIKTGNFTTVKNESWELGISESIKFGLEQSLIIEPKLEHIVFFLADQPFVNNELIDEMIATHLNGERPITASFYNGVKGVPAIFSRLIFEELKNLSGNAGAGKIICKHKVNTVKFEKGIIDIDTQEDYSKLVIQK